MLVNPFENPERNVEVPLVMPPGDRLVEECGDFERQR